MNDGRQVARTRQSPQGRRRTRNQKRCYATGHMGPVQIAGKRLQKFRVRKPVIQGPERIQQSKRRQAIPDTVHKGQIGGLDLAVGQPSKVKGINISGLGIGH